MGLQLDGGVLLAVGTSLANHADCCCGDCCSFTLCGSETPSVFACGTLPEGLTAGDIVEIDGDCYTYNGSVACAGSDPTPTYGDVFETCDQCIGIPTCISGWCSENIPSAVFVDIAGLAYDGSGLDCEDCAVRNASYEVPFNTCVGSIMSFYLELPEEACSGDTPPRIEVRLYCNSPYTEIGIQVAITEGVSGGFNLTHTISGSTSASHDFTTPVVCSHHLGGNCGASGTATVSL